jgi:hypothetical protein
VPAAERIRDLDVAHIRARGLPYDLAWEYGDVFAAAGLQLLEWRGHLSLSTWWVRPVRATEVRTILAAVP